MFEYSEDFYRERRKKYKVNRNVGMTRENAALAAGFGTTIALRRPTPPSVVDFQSLFDQQGMTNKKRVEKCIEGMNATKLTVDHMGNEHTSPDWNARHKHMETMLKLCKQLDQKGKGDTNVLIIGTLAERIKKAREKNLPGLAIKSAHIGDEGVVIDVDVMEDKNAENDTIDIIKEEPESEQVSTTPGETGKGKKSSRL